ncbi:MAG: hypothetical protein COB04_19370 [Gammaproteobacteria bacterium]|nr:MAG: hypothetical protein COB04_19370 [Gammaproteobacteria bacterium]
MKPNRLSIALGVVLTLSANIALANIDLKQTATELTTLLRSARSVTVNKVTIDDPSKFVLADFVVKTKSNYKDAAGKPFDDSDEMLNHLMDAIVFVIGNAKEGRYKDKWNSGDYAGKFLPARFAREAGLKFEQLTQGKATIRLTTSDRLLVNKQNKSQPWENLVIEQKFMASSWPKNRIYDKYTKEGFQLLLPEYYNAGCLGCHGGEQGKKIHASPIAGELGDFGGAISVFIRR